MIFNYSSFMDNVFYRTKFLLHWRRNRGGGGGGGKGGPGPPSRKIGGSAPYFAPPPPPPFHGSPLSALPSVYKFISCHTLRSTALALVAYVSEVTSGFLKMKNFPHRVRGKSLPLPPQLIRSAPSYVWPPTFKYVATHTYFKSSQRNPFKYMYLAIIAYMYPFLKYWYSIKQMH